MLLFEAGIRSRSEGLCRDQLSNQVNQSNHWNSDELTAKTRQGTNLRLKKLANRPRLKVPSWMDDAEENETKVSISCYTTALNMSKRHDTNVNVFDVGAVCDVLATQFSQESVQFFRLVETEDGALHGTHYAKSTHNAAVNNLQTLHLLSFHQVFRPWPKRLRRNPKH